MNAHKLAKILLKGEDFPVSIPSRSNEYDAEFLVNIYVLQNQESPFEYSIFLEGKHPNQNDFVDVND